ncbi:MAG: hypothetical protein V5A56_07610, partial [Halolamina sp.]
MIDCAGETLHDVRVVMRTESTRAENVEWFPGPSRGVVCNARVSETATRMSNAKFRAVVPSSPAGSFGVYSTRRAVTFECRLASLAVSHRLRPHAHGSHTFPARVSREFAGSLRSPFP